MDRRPLALSASRRLVLSMFFLCTSAPFWTSFSCDTLIYLSGRRCVWRVIFFRHFFRHLFWNYLYLLKLQLHFEIIAIKFWKLVQCFLALKACVEWILGGWHRNSRCKKFEESLYWLLLIQELPWLFVDTELWWLQPLALARMSVQSQFQMPGECGLLHGVIVKHQCCHNKFMSFTCWRCCWQNK